MKKTTKKKVVKEVKNDNIDQIYDDGSKPKVEYTKMTMPDFDNVPYVDPVVDFNDFNTQVTIPAVDGLKDELNDIKNLLKAMNENLDKIVHHLNGGWN